MHSWLPQSEAVVQGSPTVAPQPLTNATTGMVSPIIRRKIVPLASATAKSSTFFGGGAILLCAGVDAGLKAAFGSGGHQVSIAVPPSQPNLHNIPAGGGF